MSEVNLWWPVGDPAQPMGELIGVASGDIPTMLKDLGVVQDGDPHDWCLVTGGLVLQVTVPVRDPEPVKPVGEGGPLGPGLVWRVRGGSHTRHIVPTWRPAALCWAHPNGQTKWYADQPGLPVCGACVARHDRGGVPVPPFTNV